MRSISEAFSTHNIPLSSSETSEDADRRIHRKSNVSYFAGGASQPPAAAEPWNHNKKSAPIHIEGNVRRTPSEIQLGEDEQLADFRDYLMFERIVNGMMQRDGAGGAAADQQNMLPASDWRNSGPIVQHIMQTRAQPVTDGPATWAMNQVETGTKSDQVFGAWNHHHPHQDTTAPMHLDEAETPANYSNYPGYYAPSGDAVEPAPVASRNTSGVFLIDDL
jgi:hypothetical protein